MYAMNAEKLSISLGRWKVYQVALVKSKGTAEESDVKLRVADGWILSRAVPSDRPAEICPKIQRRVIDRGIFTSVADLSRKLMR